MTTTTTALAPEDHRTAVSAAPSASPSPSPSPSVVTRLLSRVQALRRVAFYAGSAAGLWRLALPVTATERSYSRGTARQSYDLHVRLLDRPGMRQAMRRAEREDLATFPVFAATALSDLARMRAKRRRGITRLAVQPADSFPYPEYYLNDFHNQANGNLSLRSALTYEWQIKFLFFGTNRLMRQGVIDQIPAGDGLDILDVGCGTAAWITQARLLGRKHRITGVDLSPDYLRVARFFRGREATFLQMNAEELAPAWASRFDLVTCIWLFHELPATAIERTVAEFARVLKPGGRVLFMDAVQAEDVPGSDGGKTNSRFTDVFNEPYYQNYQQTDLRALFARHGLAVERVERWCVSKLVALRKV